MEQLSKQQITQPNISELHSGYRKKRGGGIDQTLYGTHTYIIYKYLVKSKGAWIYIPCQELYTEKYKVIDCHDLQQIGHYKVDDEIRSLGEKLDFIKEIGFYEKYGKKMNK